MHQSQSAAQCLAALTLLCACATHSHPSTVSSAQNIEAKRLTPIIERYKKGHTITGFDIKGSTLVVYADSEKFSELDDDTETAMKGGLLAAWGSAWLAGHPHHHATVRVVLQNYYGQEITSVSKAR